MRRRHPDGRVALAAASTSPSQPSAWLPSPTASRAPARARTMLWQNASAATVATATPGSARAQSRRSSVADGGRAFAPAAAERGEIMLAQARQRGLVHPVQVERAAGVPERVVAAQRVGRARVVADPVGVAPPERGEPRVEPVGRGSDGARPGRRAAAAGPAVAGPPTGRRRPVDRPERPAWATWPRACTPASVRPATVSAGGSAQRQRPPERRPRRVCWTVAWPGWRAQPWKAEPS